MTDTAMVLRTEEPALTPFQVMERVIGSGDLSRMQPEERVAFYWRVCESTGLNPLTRPFEFITLNSKLTLYAKKDATDQLRNLHGVTVSRLERDRSDDLMVVTAHGTTKDGREDSAIGAVSIKGLSGEALANALMKAETKAKRRLTLSLVGLGFLDETEIEGAERADVDPETGEIREAAKPATLLDAVKRQQTILADAKEPIRVTPIEPLEAALENLAENGSTVNVVEQAEDALFEEVPEPAPALDLVAILRDRAGASSLAGPATAPQQARLKAAFAGVPTEVVQRGIRAAFGHERFANAAEAQAVIVIADSMGDASFREAWAQIESPA